MSDTPIEQLESSNATQVGRTLTDSADKVMDILLEKQAEVVEVVEEMKAEVVEKIVEDVPLLEGVMSSTADPQKTAPNAQKTAHAVDLETGEEIDKPVEIPPAPPKIDFCADHDKAKAKYDTLMASELEKIQKSKLHCELSKMKVENLTCTYLVDGNVYSCPKVDGKCPASFTPGVCKFVK